MKRRTDEKIINITKDRFKETGKLFWLIFSLVIVGVLTISGITIWLVLTNVNVTPSY